MPGLTIPQHLTLITLMLLVLAGKVLAIRYLWKTFRGRSKDYAGAPMIPTGSRVLYGGDVPRDCKHARKLSELTDGMKVFIDQGEHYVEADVVVHPGSVPFLQSVPEDQARDGEGSEYHVEEQDGYVEVLFGHSRAAARELQRVLDGELHGE